MVTTVAVLPEPPLLVPELARGVDAETAPLRAACLTAAVRLAATSPDWVAVGADAGGRRTVGPAARGTFAGFGVDVPVALDTRGSAPTTAADPSLPLPLLVAGWVAAAAGVTVAIRGELVGPDATQQECAALGVRLAAGPQPVGVLVVGDGAATHSEKAPRHLDERAGPFDRVVADALARADVAALAALDPGLAAELCASGRAPWQVLAGAAAGARWRGELLYSGAPFGVAYHVAVWTRLA